MSDRAQRTLERFEQRRPDAFRLAMLASLAVRVDAHLLRRLRTTLTPDADVGVEADLWFSPLVESRGVHGFVLAADSAALLRELLAAQPELLERAGAVTAAAHRDAPATIRLEEKVNTLALITGDDSLTRIDEALRPAVLTMVRDERRGLDIARWAARALPRFHPRVHETESAVLLAIGAAARLGFPLDRPDAVASADTPSDHRWVLPSAVREQSVTVGVELLADGVRFVEAGQGGALTLPRTSPLLVHLLWRDGDVERRRTIEVRTGKTERLGATVDAVRFRTLAGDEFLLAADPVRTGVDAALVEIETLGSVGPTSAGFIVAPDRIVTAAEPFRGIPILAVQHGSRSFQARVIHPAEGIHAIRLEGEGSAYLQDIMVLAPIDMPPLAPVLPLEWRLSRTDPRQSNTVIVDQRADIRWIEGNVVAHVEGDMGIRHDGPAALDLRIERDENLDAPPPRPGAPLIVRDNATGMVIRIEAGGVMPTQARRGGPFRIHAVGATVIEKVLAALPAERAGAADSDAVSTVTISPHFVVLESGTQATLLMEARDAHGTVLAGRTATWSSEDRDVFRIEQTSGDRVTGMAEKPGVAALKATCEGISGSAMVTVMSTTENFRFSHVPLIDLRRDRNELALPALVGDVAALAPGDRHAVFEIRKSDEMPKLTADLHLHLVTDEAAWPRSLDIEEAGAVLVVMDPHEDPDASRLKRSLGDLGAGIGPNLVPALVVSLDRSGSFRDWGEFIGRHTAEFLSLHPGDPKTPERLEAALTRMVAWQVQPGGSREEFERLRALLTRVERGLYPPVMPLPEFVKEAGGIRAAHAARIAGARVLESGGDTGVAVLDEKLFERIVLEIMDTRRMKDGFKGPLPVIPLEEMRRVVHGVLDGYGVSSDLYYALFDGVVGELRRIGVLGVGRGVDGDWLVYPAAFEPAGPTGQAPLQAEPVLIARSATPALREMLLVALDILASERYDIRGSYWRTPPRCGVELAERTSGAPLYLEYEPGDAYQIVLRAAYGTDSDTTAALADSVENMLRSLPHTWITIERPDAGEPAAASKQAPL